MTEEQGQQITAALAAGSNKSLDWHLQQAGVSRATYYRWRARVSGRQAAVVQRNPRGRPRESDADKVIPHRQRQAIARLDKACHLYSEALLEIADRPAVVAVLQDAARQALNWLPADLRAQA